jgi:hypothetical protein
VMSTEGSVESERQETGIAIGRELQGNGGVIVLASGQECYKIRVLVVLNLSILSIGPGMEHV